MCGIIGIIHPQVKDKEHNLEIMLDTLYHRGPDDRGIYFFKQSGLGHTRLSIIDPLNGNQPMVNRTAELGITFNGEIYGYKDLKLNLDYKFKTDTDTELILALYDIYGNNFVEKLPGMFAFGIWDEKENQLICARDRFGEKPFYYAFGINGEFIFASEIKAILASGLVQPKISNQSIVHFLKRLYVHPHQTIYSNIYSLPPAHILIYKDNKLDVKRYWNLPKLNDKISISEGIEQFRYLFNNAVRKQLVADVPVGAFLSGGLDSSTIVDVASRIQPDLQTYSFGFSNELNNELHFAKAVAEKNNTVHFEMEEKIKGLSDLIINMQTIYDEPFADSSNIPTYLISKFASNNIKVILSGDGGDEMMAGYGYWYQPIHSLQNYLTREKNQSGNVNKLHSILMKLVSPQRNRDLIEGERLFSKYKNISNLFLSQRDYFNSNDLIEFGFENVMLNNIESPENIEDVLRLDIEDYLPGDLLVKIDRASMANSLEIRSPFLDKDLAEFCISLPHRLKIKNGQGKYLMRKSFSHRWPKIVRSRKKMGFGAPVDIWLARKDIIDLKGDCLYNKSNPLYDFLDYDKVNQFRNKNNYQEWILLNLSLWMWQKLN